MNKLRLLCLNVMFLTLCGEGYPVPLTPEITEEDYKEVVNKVGIIASAGTQTVFKKNDHEYVWTFNMAVMPFPPQGQITLTEKLEADSYKFSLFPSLVHATQSVLCEFTITLQSKTSNPATLQSEAPKDSSEKDSPENLDRPPAPSPPKLGSAQYFVEKFGSYPPKPQQVFLFNNLVLSTLYPDYGCERGEKDNTSDKGEKSLLTLSDGKIRDGSLRLWGTNSEKQAVNDNGKYLWVLDKKGRLFASPQYGEVSQGALGNHHSFFLKSKPNKPYYGYGKPVAVGGVYRSTRRVDHKPR